MPTPRRDTADALRGQLETLRERRDNGGITPAEYAHLSARLLQRLKRAGESRYRYAKT